MDMVKQLDISVLPQKAQEELYDFFLFLKQRYQEKWIDSDVGEAAILSEQSFGEDNKAWSHFIKSCKRSEIEIDHSIEIRELIDQAQDTQGFRHDLSSVLFVQKWDDELCPEADDYPIFFAVSEKGGKDNFGDYIYIKNGNGQYKLDKNGHLIVDHDLHSHDGEVPDDIAEAFIEWAKSQKLSFWVEG
ncbi:MAG: hypothetical protein B6244_05940 [Candidatus Cloacimonetes bacterium 4572_55]|nr:MAG: hypothetical protein B6244_05940 [Candidatus Cloacimonetes bacterium 4572_55]